MWQKVNIVIETSNVSTHLGYGLLNPHLGMKKMQILCDTYAKHDLDGRTSLLLYCRFGLPLKHRELILRCLLGVPPNGASLQIRKLASLHPASNLHSLF